MHVNTRVLQLLGLLMVGDVGRFAPARRRRKSAADLGGSDMIAMLERYMLSSISLGLHILLALGIGLATCMWAIIVHDWQILFLGIFVCALGLLPARSARRVIRQRRRGNEE